VAFANKSFVQSPLILVTTSEVGYVTKYGVRSHYINSIYKSGGLPVAVFPGPNHGDDFDELMSLAGGVMLTGGDDLHPLIYGQQPRPGIGGVSRRRDDFELALARRAIAWGLPILGICRGMQVLNVACGGTLHQDICALGLKDGILHAQTAPRDTEWHTVSMEPQSRLADIFGHLCGDGRTLQVNSIHHQAVASVAARWKVTAVAPDGIIEGIESEDHDFAVGVQWHPEELPRHSVIFDAFVDAAKSAHR